MGKGINALYYAQRAIEGKVLRMAARLGGEYHTSQRGVPLIILRLGGRRSYSVCWFGRSKVWRVFYPWGEPGPQTKMDMATDAQLVEWVNSQRGKRRVAEVRSFCFPPEPSIESDGWGLE